MINLINIENRLSISIARVNSLKKNNFEKIFQSINSLKKEIGKVKKCLNDLGRIEPVSEDENKKMSESESRCEDLLTSWRILKSELYKKKNTYEPYGIFQ